MPLTELSSDFDAVFVGSEIEREVMDEFDENGARLTFEVTEVYLGDIGEVTEVFTHAQESACGATFNPGESTTVFVREWQGQPNVSLCDQFIEFEDGDLETEFGPSSAPSDAAAVPPDDGGSGSGSSSSNAGLWVGIMVLAFLIGGGCFAYIRRNKAAQP